MSTSYLIVKNAREHNLKRLTLKIPREQFNVVTGVSGSGKSSLVFDTIFKEGQRRYVASLSAYARQFIQTMERPLVDSIEGLSPTISIEQKSVARNPRSTVGTITEVYDFLRLLFSRLAVPHCPKGHGPITVQSREAVLRMVQEKLAGKLVFVMAPVVRDRKGEYRKELLSYFKAGFARVFVDKTVRNLDEELKLERYKKHTIELIIDRVRVNEASYPRLQEAFEKAASLAEGRISLWVVEQKNRRSSASSTEQWPAFRPQDYFLYNLTNACSVCGESVAELEPKLFSFNSPAEACPECTGLGYKNSFELERFVKDDRKSIFDGALGVLNKEGDVLFTSRGHRRIVQLFVFYDLKKDTPWRELPPWFKDRLLTGKGSEKDRIDFSILELLEWVYQRYHIKILERFMRRQPCEACEQSGLNALARNVTFFDKRIHEYAALPVKELYAAFKGFDMRGFEPAIWKPIFTEIKERLFFLMNVGLEYLTLDRRANTLSGGEAQRIRLASQVGSGLEGCLYVLDEPSIGLHPEDNQKLIDTLKKLRDKRNSLLVIEHDEETMLQADYLLEIGPQAGALGGRVVFSGPPTEFFNTLEVFLRQQKTRKAFPPPAQPAEGKGKVASLESSTFKFLSGLDHIPVPQTPRPASGWLRLKGVTRFNLKALEVSLPLGNLILLTGVSGSGKSTLMEVLSEAAFETLYRRKRANSKSLSNRTDETLQEAATPLTLHGAEQLDKLIEISQRPLGRTSRSNPATYTKAWDHIRDLFAQSQEAKLRGYKKGRFSFNVKGGRCEECNGTGVIEVDLQLFAAMEVRCEACDGKRFNLNTLAVTYRGKTIHQVLEMTIAEASEFFAKVPKVARILQFLKAIGLFYMQLGQSSTTLSGGEAQRIRLAAELSKNSTGKTLYLLDEPTTGLHFEDIRNLINALNTLVERGNTVVVIEHNLELIKIADHLIELGPGGGDQGGRLVKAGAVADFLLPSVVSKTSAALKTYLERQRKRERGFFLKKKNFKTLFPAAALKTLKAAKKQKQKQTATAAEALLIRGLKTHNLKNIHLTLPKNKLIVFTGVSGSGKTSIALDSIFSEGQRKYLESLSTYARRFLGRIARVSAEAMENISPTIAIQQKKPSRNPRSTIATQTELYDSLRTLYANIGQPHCRLCSAPLQRHSETLAVKALLAQQETLPPRLLFLAPLFFKNGPFPLLFKQKEQLWDGLKALYEKGYTRLWIDGKMKDAATLLQNATHSTFKAVKFVAVVLDRIAPSVKNQSRLIEVFEKGYELGSGVLYLAPAPADPPKPQGKIPPYRYTKFYSCPHHPVFLKEALTPRHFSFNYHLGACETCRGLGEELTLPEGEVVTSEQYPLLRGALHEAFDTLFQDEERCDLSPLLKAAEARGLNLLETPYFKFTAAEKNFIYWGALGCDWQGFPTLFEAALKRETDHFRRVELNRLWRSKRRVGTCPACRGGRLQPDWLMVKVAGFGLHQLMQQPLPKVAELFRSFNHPAKAAQLGLSALQLKMSTVVVEEINFRLQQMLHLGMDYLTLERKMATLSGGETQRVALSTQLGNKLVDVIYVLDEPTVGLHERDKFRLLEVMQTLRDLGNTVLVVEHEQNIIRKADYLVDVGPGAGTLGGEVVYAGENTASARRSAAFKKASFYPYLYADKKNAAADFVYHRPSTHPPEKSEKGGGDKKAPPLFLTLRNITENNLKNVTVTLPLGKLIGIAGVSGSGKSSLVAWLRRQLEFHFENDAVSGGALLVKDQAGKRRPFPFKQLVFIDQSPVTGSRRSIVASYMEIYTELREIFAVSRLAKERGFDKGHFSFNSVKGACRRCGGQGEEEVEMHFISDVTVVCEECRGKRFRQEVLEVYYQGKNIYEALNMTFAEAHEHFRGFAKIRKKIARLLEAGLGYLKLGFKTSLLSGGERQRLKIAHDLAYENPSQTFYVLDEPTTGLHFKDLEKLVLLIDALVVAGGTVVVVEHNIEFLRSVDYLLDLGPEGGEGGGRVMAAGTPAAVKKAGQGATAQYL